MQSLLDNIEKEKEKGCLPGINERFYFALGWFKSECEHGSDEMYAPEDVLALLMSLEGQN